MRTIKLGKNTYRVYFSAPTTAVSYLFFVKNDQPILKRIDAPAEFFKRDNDYQIVMQRMAVNALESHLREAASFWTIQGDILGSMA